MSTYSAEHSRFYLIFSKSRQIEGSGFEKTGYKRVEGGRTWLFCADNVAGLPADIGYRYNNGDGVYLRIFREDDLICFETDELSGVPVFWIEKDGWVIIASDLSLLIEICRIVDIGMALDMNSASEFLVTGYVFTDRKTLLKDVSLLSPQHRLTLDTDNGLVEIQNLAGKIKYSSKRLNPDSAPRIFREILEKGYKRHSDKKAALLLSGGGSSRIIASCAVASGLDVDFYTFGQSTVNDSDFSIANTVAYKLGKKTRCYATSADNFIANWKKMAARSNWTNDSIWWSARIPDAFFHDVGKYDIVLRGDGDGCYGWGGDKVSVSDILHLFEVTLNTVMPKYNKYFSEPQGVFSPAMESRDRLVSKYEKIRVPLLELKNIMYREVRECHGAAPGTWYFSRFMKVDNPFLWHDCLNIAFSLPTDKLVVRWIIFAALELDRHIKGIPFSGGGSWNNRLDFYYSGAWNMLLDYVNNWSPWKLNISEFKNEYMRPPEIPRPPSFNDYMLNAIKDLAKNRYIRKAAFKLFPNFPHSSMSDRLLIRLAIISNLSETISKNLL